MLVPIFSGTIAESGKVNWVKREESQRRRYLETLIGEQVEIVIRKRRSQRSVDQNKYWHAVPFKLLAEALGYDSIEELKFDLMGEKWGWVETKGGHRVPIKMHTSLLTVEEGVEFTDWLIRFGATLPSPVLIPLPNEVLA